MEILSFLLGLCAMYLFVRMRAGGNSDADTQQLLRLTEQNKKLQVS